VYTADYFKGIFRTMRDWPRPGVNFRDVTTLFHDPVAFSRAIDVFAEESDKRPFDIIAAVDARGFTIGGALAYRLRKPFVLVRKKGKLPFKTISENYQLEYGPAAVEIHMDACKPGDRVLIVDDLIATGGTLLAAAKLFHQLGGTVVGVAALIDLVELGGSKKLRAAGYNVHVLCEFTESE
jgi:adenine phosphoribosyltransferase